MESDAPSATSSTASTSASDLSSTVSGDTAALALFSALWRSKPKDVVVTSWEPAEAQSKLTKPTASRESTHAAAIVSTTVLP